MKFYEVITNAYVNEAIVWNDVPDYLCTWWPIVKVR
jgi:hypothetical protein